MAYGIYILDQDRNYISDIEAFLLIAPEYSISGSGSMIDEAVNAVKSNPAIKCVLIGQELADGDYMDAINKLSALGVMMIVAFNKNIKPEEKQRVQSMNNCECFVKPLNFTELSAILDKAINFKSEKSYTKPKPEKLDTSSIDSDDEYSDRELKDNPYLVHTQSNDYETDVRARLMDIRRGQVNASSSRFIPQLVIAVHNPKGGVGKSTVAIDLSVAISKMSFIKNDVEYKPKVCLCDFDLDASDISLTLNFSEQSEKNIGKMVNDIKVEAQRAASSKGKAEPVENIRFTLRDIEQKYLQLHETGIYVLQAPSDNRISRSIRKGEVNAVIENLKACDFDIIVIDTAPNILDYTISTLVEADIVLAVSTCEINSIHRLSSEISVLQNIPGFSADKIKLVINKYDDRQNISPEELTHILRLENVGIIPFCFDIGNIHNYGYSAFNSTIALNDKNSYYRYLEAIRRLARKVMGVNNKSPENTKPKSKGLFRFRKKGEN